MISATKKAPRWIVLVVALLVLGAISVFLFEPGFFTVDESHHFTAVRTLSQGRLHVPEYQGLSASLELAHFDPDPLSRPPDLRTTRVPPLYSIVAAPFFLFGIRGLFFLNLLAFLGTLVLVFFWTKLQEDKEGVAWLATAVFLFGTYSLEYALGLWPHILSTFLCTLGLFLLARRRGDGRAWLVFAAGLSLALAVGVRYPNILILFFSGMGLMIWGRQRCLDGGLFFLGSLVPLSASSLLNFYALDSLNPISKGGKYLSLGAGRDLVSMAGDAFNTLWFRIVDFTARPSFSSGGNYRWDRILPSNPDTGAFLVAGGGLKKAWLQSSPWILLALVFMGLAWWNSFRRRRADLDRHVGRRREILAMSLVVAGVLAGFAIQSPNRTDGICYNQRYLIDLLPVLAVVLAWGLAEIRMRGVALGLGSMIGGLLAGLALFFWREEDAIRQIWLMKVPLFLAAALLLAWIFRRVSFGPRMIWAALGLCMGWSLVVHLGDDLASSQELRGANREIARVADSFLPHGPTAVVVDTGFKEGFAPLQLDRDLVIVAPWINGGRDTGRLVEALLNQGRRVFFFKPGMPKDFAVRVVREGHWLLSDPGHPQFREILMTGKVK
ncbi:MAG: hypothetical protein JRF33_16095 [Deltaproteobacteria bacterium]|nr:hypothetical protein [Deltaproteobacteria bacterium]